MAIDREKVQAAAQKLVEKGKYDKAVIELRRIVDVDPHDARTLHKIGELQVKQHLYAEAIDTFETVGKLYAAGGFAHKGVAVYKQIRQLIATHLPQAAAKYGHIAPKLAELYREIGLTSEALTLLDEVATNLQRQGREPEALEYLRGLSELDPNNPLTHLRLAEALGRARDLEGAVTSFKAAVSILVEANRRDDALQVLERLLQHKADPEQARRCAELYLSRARAPHDGMQALTKLQICIAASPRDVEILGLVARAFHLIGDREKAAAVQKEIARMVQSNS